MTQMLCGFCKGPLVLNWCPACEAIVEEDAQDAPVPQQKGEKMPKGEPASGCREVELVRLILSSYQTAYAKFHCEEKRKVVESHNMAIGYASAELALALQSVPSSPWPNKTGSAVLSPQIIREAVERVRQQIAAAPSDAGQPALEKLRELLMRIRADLIQYVNDKECPVCGEDLQGTHEPFCSIGELIMEAAPQQPAEQD